MDTISVIYINVNSVITFSFQAMIVVPMKHKCSQEMEYAAILANICILNLLFLDIPHGILC